MQVTSIDAGYLRQRVAYDAETGIFTYLPMPDDRPMGRQWNGKCAGKKAGHRSKRGYIVIRIDRVLYTAHRLAFIWMTGSCPDLVDHKNCDGMDNRWDNLRPATKSQNSINTPLRKSNTSGTTGVSWFKPAKLWQAEIRRRGVKRHLGYFKKIDEAVAARKRAEETLPDAEYTPNTSTAALRAVQCR